jgi:tetratricopeptide (TPR) repeat protein
VLSLAALASHDPDRAVRERSGEELLDRGKERPLPAPTEIAAWRALVDSSRGVEALEHLEKLYDRAGDRAGLGEVLSLRAERESNPEVAQTLSFRAAELAAEGTEPSAAVALWQKHVSRYGASRTAYARMIPLLEKAALWPELARVLESDIELAPSDERPAIQVRLATVQKDRLGDAPGAIASLRAAVTDDPTHAAARALLERMLEGADTALPAADILAPVYESEAETTPRSAGMLGRLAALRVDAAPNPQARLDALAGLQSVLDRFRLERADRLTLVERALGQVAALAPAMLPAWIERAEQWTDDAAAERASVLARILEAGIDDEPVRRTLLVAAGSAFERAGWDDRALELYDAWLARDPSSPEVLARFDAVAERAGRNAADRVARYRAALTQASGADRRAQLLTQIGELEKHGLGDVTAAKATWQAALDEHPTHVAAHEALLAACIETSDAETYEHELSRALRHFSGEAREQAMGRLADLYLTTTRPEQALDLCRQLVDEPVLGATALDVIDRVAAQTDDSDLRRRAIERRVEVASTGQTRAQALERLGEFYDEFQGDPARAADAWREAGEAALSIGSTSEGLRLFERVLTAAPEDPIAAARLVALYAANGEWARVPEASHVLLGGSTDAAASIELLLSLEPQAKAAGAAEEFAGLVDDSLWRLGADDGSLAARLQGAKARVFAAAGRYDDAARVYQALIEARGHASDIAEFETLIDSNPGEDWRHQHRAWLFEWSAARSKEPVAVLLAWAHAEEQEFEDAQAAIRVYERVLSKDATLADAWEALARLKVGTGDVVGGLEALGHLRGLTSDERERAVELQTAELLIERLDQPEEALAPLEVVLRAEPQSIRGQALALQALGHPGAATATRVRAAELVDSASSAQSDDQRRTTLRALLEASASAADANDGESRLGALRLHWLTELMGSDSGDDLAASVRQAGAQFAEHQAIWDLIERAALRAKQPLLAVQAYEAALEGTLSVDLAEALGRRLAAFAERHLDNPRAIGPALERLLELAPTARWALDHVKFVLSSEQRWARLFGHYDRVIAAVDEQELRCELLNEAAVAARDVAGDAERAIRYWKQYFTLRPEDARVDATLERLYERQRHTAELIDHLMRRLPALDKGERAKLLRRVSGLWIDQHDVRSALDTIDLLVEGDPDAAGSVQLLERILELTGSWESVDVDRTLLRRAADLLKERYTRLGKTNDVARVVKLSLVEAADDADRAHLLGELAGLQPELGEREGAFESLAELLLLQPTVAEHRHRLAELAGELRLENRYAELLTEAATRVEDTPNEIELLGAAVAIYAELGNQPRAADLYTRILERSKDRVAQLDAGRRLERLLSSLGRPADRCKVLETLSSLERDPTARREALREAAEVALEELAEPDRAVTMYRSLLDDEPELRTLHDGLVRALRSAGRWEELAAALVRRGAVAETPADRRASLVEAARIQATRLNHPDEAIDLWRWIRDNIGRDAKSLEALIGLYESTERWSDLAALLEAEAAVSDTPAALYARLARVHRESTGDLPAALAAHVKGGDLHAAADLFCSADELLVDDPALTVALADALRGASDFATAERVLSRQLTHYAARHPKERGIVHSKLGEVHEAAGRPEAAIAEFGRAAEILPADGDVLTSLGRLSMARGDLDRAEQSYRSLLLVLHQARRAGSSTTRAQVYIELSEVAALRKRPDQAKDLVASAFEAALDSPEEAVGLENALRRNDWNDLLERAVKGRLERSKTPAAVVGALGDLVELRAKRGALSAHFVAEAAEYAEDVGTELSRSKSKSLDIAPWARLVSVYERLGDHPRAMAALDRLAERAPDAPERVRLELALSASLARHPGQRVHAISRLWLLVKDGKGGDEATDNLSTLLDDDGRLDEMIELVTDQLTAAKQRGDAPAADELTLRLGAVYERAGRLEEARDTFAAAAMRTAPRRAALKALVKVEEQLGAPAERIAVALESLLSVEDGSEAADVALRLAALYAERGDSAERQRALERGAEADPAHVEVGKALLELYDSSAQWQRAAELLERAIEVEPNDASTRLRLARAHRKAGAIDPALRALDWEPRTKRDEAAFHQERHHIHEAAGRFDDAVRELDAASRIEPSLASELITALEGNPHTPSSEEWSLRLARLLIEAGALERARRALDDAIDQIPDSLSLATLALKLAKSDSDWSSAVSLSQRIVALATGPARVAAALELAKLAQAAESPRQAIGALEQVVAEDPDAGAAVRASLCALYAASGDRKKQAALTVERASLETDVDTRIALLTESVELYRALSDQTAALAVLETLRELDPERLEVALLSASLLVEAGQSDRALILLSECAEQPARRRERSSSRLHRAIADIHLAADDIVEAGEALTKAHQLDRADLDTALTLGLCSVDLDDTDTANSALRVVISAKNHDEVWDRPTKSRYLSRAYYQLASIDFTKGQKTSARRLATRASEEDPENRAAARLLDQISAS